MPTNQPGEWLRVITPLALALAALMLLLSTAAPLDGFAADPGRVITLGESLSAAQREELRDYFNVAGDDDVITITTEDTIAAMEGIYAPEQITSAFSSTALTCRDLGDGLDVTTRNINVVNPGLYAMALVTAGIGDATLVVAAPTDAPAQGMTALAGVFKSWDIAPCASGDTSKARQRLALEELTLTVQIGQALQAAGSPNGVQVATTLVLETQKTIVTDELTKRDEIDKALAAREKKASVTIPATERAKLVSLMTRLAEEEIDWSTFAAGWEITWSENNQRISMTGDGIAIRNARASATAEAELAAEMTATAEAELAAQMTATAEAQRAADLQATAEARRAALEAAEAKRLAANAARSVTQTGVLAAARATDVLLAVPAPARPMVAAPSRPMSLAVRGVLADNDGTFVSVVDATGMTPSGAYVVDPAATIRRDGQPAALAALAQGDRAELTVDAATGRVTLLELTSAPVAEVEDRRAVWGMALVGALGLIWLKRRRTGPPFVIQRR